MIARKIKREEYSIAEAVGSIAFEFPIEESTLKMSNEERIRRQMEHPSSHTDYYTLSRFAAFDDDGTMMGVISTYPYQVRFGGTELGMSGVGFVSTRPEYRRRGVIRECMRVAIQDMKDRGDAFAALYPFSVQFYRKFGYELAPQTMEWVIPMSVIPDFPEEGGKFHLYLPGEPVDDFEKVYRDFCSRYDLTVVREKLDFALFQDDPLTSKKYWYLYRGKNGEPKGYLRFFKDTVDGERRMNCSSNFRQVEFAFSDAEGLKALLRFAKSFSSDYDCLTVALSPDFPLEFYLGETNPIRRNQHFMGMYRVVDAQKVLGSAVYQGSGSLSIELSDPMAPWNEGVFSVSFENGKAVQVEKTSGGDAQVSMGIREFTRLITGCFEKEQIRIMPNVEIREDTPAIDQVFFKKSIWLHDFF